ncbi:30S ribosomal protein S4 [Candidatus Woesebacteria bacterium RIFCSPHIGHO2_02_FULL_38_9]|uniref:Small ribosomal subunit protein uS4 n=1 Tax=Candidatus Woesebacteria bacterium RIFCSPHIGHO2_01_FULL_39_28 TaxID=1802496 RepID=A0A1F7YA29_9BACT|nr:MAG: 30S ribosomal protein S4 [Candidatus Woesebacteria bacterium RIFCSPHIGHO2_01_FULL_39_28]OGM32228.1 MAG: 30S ribosomal protein S4 [Candidatus Woesebacteria bacterium RIFCSPHIGHO2_02_FULL_38_9]OGM58452.1 MAG: 30S ribosomal protein S4 [Candidatus Woesebacteria bacterium RIFCSPLOWO2_01_FULL_38_20]
MAKYNGPKDRLSRREGFDLYGAGSKLTRLMVPPGVHGPKGVTRKPSQYGRQLREKQKVKRLYGVLESQFRRYVGEALKTKGNTGNVLLFSLESRLDNVVYRLHFAESRPQARQIVSHKHVVVNGKKVNIPSYKVKVGDVVNLSGKIMESANFQKLLQEKNYIIPEWLERKGPVGRVTKMITRDDIKEPISEQDIVEFYSR